MMYLGKNLSFYQKSSSILALLLLLGQTSLSFAQSPADDFARRQDEQQKKQQLEQLRRFTPNDAQAPKVAQPIFPVDGKCFAIEHVVIEGATKISARSIAKITAPYQGKCINLADIQELMKNVTNAYLDQGYVTARAYIPEQDIKKSRIFKLVVSEGKLSDIYYNGKPVSPYNGVIMSAFPGLNGHVLNMRDVEQGLDQMNRLASNNAKSEMLPGRSDGNTILNVTNQPDKRWQVNLSHDTLGQASTGYARYNAGVTLDNILQVNDIWNFGYQRTDKDYWKGNRLDGNSNSYSGSVSIPHGDWTFNFSGYKYDYHSIVPGNFGPIQTNGDSEELRGNATRVIHRDAKSITTMNMGLAYKETNNFLLGNKIEVGSREYSVGNLGVSHSRQMLKGTWTFDLSYLQGLDIFGAVKKHEPSAGNADPKFSKFTGTISVMTPFKVSEQNFILNNLLVAQYAPDNLFGSEQISIGSYSNVRGARESLIYGNSGFFTRNEIIWRTVPWGKSASIVKALGEFRPYVGLDYGQVFSQKRYGTDDDHLASWTVGAKLSGGRISVESGYSNVFSTNVNSDKTGMAFMSAGVTF